MKVGVVGGRGLDHPVIMGLVFSKLDMFIHKSDTIVSGGATGIDAMAKLYAEQEHISYIEYPPLDEDGTERFHKRNERIAKECEVLLAFPSPASKGTWHTVWMARKMEKRVVVYEVDDERLLKKVV